MDRDRREDAAAKTRYNEDRIRVDREIAAREDHQKRDLEIEMLKESIQYLNETYGVKNDDKMEMGFSDFQTQNESDIDYEEETEGISLDSNEYEVMTK